MFALKNATTVLLQLWRKNHAALRKELKQNLAAIKKKPQWQHQNLVAPKKLRRALLLALINQSKLRLQEKRKAVAASRLEREQKNNFSKTL